MPRPRTSTTPTEVDVDALREWQRKLLENLPAWLSFRGMKQTDLAERLGLSDPQISKYLSGTVNMKFGLLLEIANVLKTHPGDLLRPPPSEGVGMRVEETLRLMEQVSPEQWDAVLQMARTLVPKKDAK